MALINDRERQELLGGMRGLPLRLVPALLTTVLLFLSGDMVGSWALAWVALVPLCYACRGVGGPGAFVLAVVAFLPAAVLQSFWLIDTGDANPVAIWLAAGFLPALPFLAIEMPVCRSVPWALRPLLLAALATGCWYLLPGDAEFLIPVGGLIDSELVRLAYPQLGLATMAGLFTGLAWLGAELFHNPRQRGRAGWPGIALAVVLLIATGADWGGSAVKPQPVGVKDTTWVHVVPGNNNLVKRTEVMLPGDNVELVIWNVDIADPERRVQLVSQGGELAARARVNLIMLQHTDDASHAYVYLKGKDPVATHSWSTGDAEPLIVEGKYGAIIEGVGRMRIFPNLDSPEHWASMWDLELYLGKAEPAHPAQLRYWLREQRRKALIRGSRQICTWAGGAVAIDGIGRVIARSGGEPFIARLPAGEERGQPLGRARLTVLERILAMAAPVIILMLILLTPVRWAKQRYRARQQPDFAIEEVIDDETTLSKEETQAFTRRYEKPD